MTLHIAPYFFTRRWQFGFDILPANDPDGTPCLALNLYFIWGMLHIGLRKNDLL